MKPWTVMLQFSFTAAARRHGFTVSPIALLLASIVAASCGSSDQTKQVRGQSGADAGASDADGGKSPAASGGAPTESQAGGGGEGESILGAAGESSGGASSGAASSGGAAVGGSATGGAESSGGFAGSGGKVGGGGTGGTGGTNAMAGSAGTGGGPACGGANLQTDVNNCGICQRSCGTGACSHGHCMLALTKQITSPGGLAVDGTYAYYGTHASGDIYRVPLAGGTPVAVVTKNVADQTEQLILVGSELFWTSYSDQKVLKAPKAGDTATSLSDSESIPYGIASNGTDVFWANHYQPSNAIGHALASGATTKNPVISGTPDVNYPTYVAMDATFVFWGNAGTSGTNGSLMRAKLDGSQPTPLAQNQYPIYGIAVDANNVYFSTINTGTVSMVPKAGGAITPLGSNEGYVYGVAVDGKDVYWLDTGKGVLRHRSLLANAPETIADLNQASIDPYLGSPTYLTLDATHVYYSDGGTQYGHGAIISVTRE
jgi:hypothetical protein